MNPARRSVLLILLALLPLAMVQAAVDYPPVVPGYRIEFPRDEASHPEFRTEWWYVTGWLETADKQPIGFQVTFFRSRPGTQEQNPSRFAAKQVVLAHAAISDPRRARLLRGERVARAGFGLAYAKTETLDVAIEDWSLRALDSGRTDSTRFRTTVVADEFSYELDLESHTPPLLHGRDGFSQKSPLEKNASYYYSRPQMRVSGVVRTDRGAERVTGHAWMDHEWSTEFLEPEAKGWDWIGINLDDGGALMVSRIRGADGSQRWAFATWSSGGVVRRYRPEEIEWSPLRRWRSPHTGIEFPVEWRVRIGDRNLVLRPLFDDQENDTRGSTRTIYWEGAVTVFDEADRRIGRGYLELTGYRERLTF